jgi:NAD(P)H-nitrite reductase large subunit
MHITIVGNGISALTAVKMIRKNQKKIRISIYTAEEHPYYPRPKISDVLLGKDPPTNLFIP